MKTVEKKYTKESFALNIQTNNITWDLWRYVAGILLLLGWSRKNENKSNENIQWHSTEWYGKNNEHINNDDDDDDDDDSGDIDVMFPPWEFSYSPKVL